MKILDRYVLSAFVKNYLISLMVLMGLYILLDLVFNFDELIEVQTQNSGASVSGGAAFLAVLWVVFDYYFYQMFLIFAQLSGVIPVAAAAFTLVRFSRFNELSPVLSAGVPLFRFAAPIIFAALGLTALLWVDQELIIPRLVPKLTRSHDQVAHGATKVIDIKAMQDGKGGLLFASRYMPATPETPAQMFDVDIIERDDEYRAKAHVLADRAEYDETERFWKLTKGVRITGLRPAERRTQRAVAIYQSNVTPEEISLFRSGDYVELLSTRRIDQLLERPQSYGTNDLLRVKHSRLTQWIMNLVAVGLTIGTILTREPGTLKTSGIKLLIVVGLAMATVFLCHQIAARPPAGEQWVDRWPALMAWVPVFLFGPLTIFLLDRLHTQKS